MLEGYDDCDGMELEEILAEEPEIDEVENLDACHEEIDMAIAEVKGDLYFIHADSYLEEIEKSLDEFRNKPEIDDHHDWQDEVEQAIAEVRDPRRPPQ